ncbi:MAG: cupin domain-containing protein [Promethearchaeota archaeon]|nr:MAG: cupin domain-containing protein [Candidatus Lokiarchaeota archaeon]
MNVKYYKDVEEEVVTKANSTKTTIRWLITKEDGPMHFATRRFKIKPGGKIGIHNHKEEHHIYVLEGQAEFLDDKGNKHQVRKDNTIFIPPNEKHGINNNQDTNFIFICIIPYLE